MRQTGMRLILVALAVVGSISMVADTAYAQAAGATATLTGQVTDQTGAAIPGAQLTITATSTAVTNTTVSNDLGYYTFPFLRPTTYTLVAKKSGFSDVTIPEITLLVNQTANIAITMTPGKLVQQVTVSASAVELQTQNATLGAVVTEQPIRQLPLLLRDDTSLVDLVPGVTADFRNQVAGEDRNGLSFQGRLDFTANGGIREQATAMVDGIDITTDHGDFDTMPIVPTPDTTQEFQVTTNNYSSEYGRGTVVLNVLTKSGTNKYHGSVYDYEQSDRLNAQDLFLNALNEKKAFADRHQAGFTLGGPIRKDKIWAFGDWEKMYQARALAVVLRVPTAAEVGGNFNNEYATSGAPITIYNPFDTYVDPTTGRTMRRPFPNNTIPSSMLDSFAEKVISYYAPPNNPGVIAPGGLPTNVGNLSGDFGTTPTWARMDYKVDWVTGEHNKFMARYSRSYYKNPEAHVYNTPGDAFYNTNRNDFQPGMNGVFSWTRTVSPTFVITQGWSYSWFRDFTPRFSTDRNFNVASLGGPFSPSTGLVAFDDRWAGGTAFPDMGISGYGDMGEGNSDVIDEPADSYGYQIGLVKTKAAHTFKFGFQTRVVDQNERAFNGEAARLNVSGSWTDGPDPLVPSPNTGNPLADLLVGLVGSGTADAGYTTANRSEYFATYFQDDWRVTPKLTLNLGLRWDMELPFEDRFNHYSRFSYTIPNPIGDESGPNTGGQSLNGYFVALDGRPLTGAVVWPSTPGYGRRIDKADSHDFGPRVGLAYRLSNKLVFRGAFAKIYGLSPVSAPVSAVGPPGNTVSTSIVSTLDGIHPNVTVDNPFPSGFLTPSFDSQGLETLLGHQMWAPAANGVTHTPYSYQWNAGFEYELPANSVLSVSYAGSKGRYLTCPFFFCSDEIPYAEIQKFGAHVFDTVPNPFYGIITDPTASLSAPTVQLGQLLLNHPEYTGLLNMIPATQGPHGNDFGSHWESMQVGLKKAYSHGLQMTLAYTLSKNITNADSFENGYLGPTANYQDMNDFSHERSLSAEDVTHRLVIAHVYDLPVGHGRQFGASWPSVLDKVAGGWQATGVITVSSGFPIAPYVSPDNRGAFGGAARPNLVGSPCISGISRGQRIIQDLNPAAFAFPAAFTFGDAPRLLNGCRADGMKNYDFSLIKDTQIREYAKLEVRMEAFNIFNRPQLSPPNATFGSAGFGSITSMANLPRYIQLALKIIF